MSTSRDLPAIGIVLGDPTGVGPEIAAKLAASDFFRDICRPIFIGDVRVFAEGLRVIGGNAAYYPISEVSEADWDKGYPILDTGDQDPARITYGAPDPYCGEAGIRTFQLACSLCKEGKLEGFTFGPYHKAAMLDAGMPFESEHHLIAHEFGVTTPFGETNYVDNLMTFRCTSHIPISEIAGALTKELIVSKISLGHERACDIGIQEPRIGVSGLNPHCGEGGRVGREELDIIEPAIKECRQKGWNVQGPISPDLLFYRAFNKKEFDVAIVMYHDQGQIATKLHGFEGGITISGGMPYPVVTCGHGTAYGRAGQGRASTTSFENAVKMTARMALSRRK